jgi:hypothetical protein
MSRRPHIEPEPDKTYIDGAFTCVAVLHHKGKRLIVGIWHQERDQYVVMQDQGWCFRVCGCSSPYRHYSELPPKPIPPPPPKPRPVRVVREGETPKRQP